MSAASEVNYAKVNLMDFKVAQSESRTYSAKGPAAVRPVGIFANPT